nr:hypothetical protein [Tanacetum cinerariifolium]
PNGSRGWISDFQVLYMDQVPYFDDKAFILIVQVFLLVLPEFLLGFSHTYALTHNPIIFDSLVKQFWSTATLKSLGLGPSAIQATIDETPYIITKDLVRSQLQLADDGGIDDFPIAKIYSGMDNLGTKSGSWDQFGSPLAVALFVYLTGDNLTGLATFLREWLVT